ncbi:MAG: hypothetical protein VX726_01700 [Planctomycetota bacterium]|nr:hypothetical protein [Planctomycetota bacterium]
MILSNDLLAIVYVMLALIGALIALLAWRGNRDGRERWCPVCDHDLSGTDARTCPACGFHSTDERRFRAPRRRPLLAIVGLVLVLVPSVLAVGSGAARSTSGLLRATWTRVEVQPLPGGLEVVHLISEQGDEASFRHRIQVRNETNEVLLDWKGWSARLGFLDSTTAKRIGLGGDIDRNGEPDLVLRVQESAVDQGSWLVISIADRAGRPRVQPEAILRGGVFSDVDLDGQMEFVADDARLRSRWFEPRRIQVAETVLVPSPDGWRFDAEATRVNPWPSSLESDPERALTSAHEGWMDGRSPFITDLFSVAMQMVARGRLEEARRFVARPWPGDADPGVLGETEVLEVGQGDWLTYPTSPRQRVDLLERLVEESRFREELRGEWDEPADP